MQFVWPYTFKFRYKPAKELEGGGKPSKNTGSSQNYVVCATSKQVDIALYGKGPTVWLLSGAGGVWTISEKNILQTVRAKKKFLQGNNCHTMALYVGEKILSPEVWRKKFLTQTKSPTPPSKVKPSARKWTISFKWQQLHFIYISASSEGIWTN